MEAKTTLEKHVATKLQKENPDKTPRGKNFQGKNTVEQISSSKTPQKVYPNTYIVMIVITY